MPSRAKLQTSKQRRRKLIQERRDKGETFICRECGADLFWREHQTLVESIYADTGEMRKGGEVVYCALDVECSSDPKHLCGWKFDEERFLVPVK